MWTTDAHQLQVVNNKLLEIEMYAVGRTSIISVYLITFERTRRNCPQIAINSSSRKPEKSMIRFGQRSVDLSLLIDVTLLDSNFIAIPVVHFRHKHNICRLINVN